MSLYDPDVVEIRNRYLFLLRMCSDSAMLKVQWIKAFAIAVPILSLITLLYLVNVNIISPAVCILCMLGCPLLSMPFVRSFEKLRAKNEFFLQQEHTEHVWPVWRASIYRARCSVLVAYQRKYFNLF